jgi:hypothetical protein
MVHTNSACIVCRKRILNSISYICLNFFGGIQPAKDSPKKLPADVGAQVK